MGILRSKFNVSEAAGEADAASEETSRKSPTTSPQKAAQGQRGRKRVEKGQMTLADLAAPTREILREGVSEEEGEQDGPTDAQLSALAQVRDLIAGPQLSDYNTRISALEATAREQAALTVQLRDAITALERSAAALGGRCDAETGDRKALADGMRTSLNTLGGDLVSSEDRLRSEIVAQGSIVTGLVHQRAGELRDEIRSGLEQLGSDKASRSALASLLVAAAHSLDDKPPSKND